MTTATEAPHHRNLTCIKQYGCQLPACLERGRAYQRNRYRQQGYGTWQPLVDAEPVRQHVANLRQDGASIPSIAEAAHISTATLARLLYGVQGGRPAAKLRAESAQAVLAVRAEDCAIPDGARIDGTGTRRRLQALVAMGWPFTALGPEIGIHPRPLTSLARAEYVTAGTARKVKAGYRRLSLLLPEQNGIPAQARNLARHVARREGWVPPMAWDNIDDPLCQPEIDHVEDTVAVKRDNQRNEEIRHLAAFGIPHEEIAKRVGLSRARDVTDRLNKWAKEAAA